MRFADDSNRHGWKDSLGLGLTIWSPLGSGVLTGKYSKEPCRLTLTQPDLEVQHLTGCRDEAYMDGQRADVMNG